MSKFKKIFLLALSVILLVVFALVAFLYLDFRNSVRYSSYQLAVAKKYQDSEKALLYYDIDKITGNLISEAAQELQGEKDPLVVAIGQRILSGLKMTLPVEYKKSLIKEFETKSEQLSSMNDFEIFYLSFLGKPILTPNLETQKLSDGKVKQIFCVENICTIKIWEKEDNTWKIVDIKQQKN